MVVSWPNGIEDKGAIRSQFSHVNDITPTILEAAGIATPAEVNGVAQKPMDGQSLVYSFNDPEAAERHQTQYFEVLANVALYHQGWMLSGRNRARVPWGRLTSTDDEKEVYDWELYDLQKDFSQARDLADAQPERLALLQNLFWAEAGRNQVLPLSGRPAGQKPFPALGEGRKQVTYSAGAVGLHESAVPDLKNTDHRVLADIVVPEEGAQGVIASLGGVVAGWSLYVTEEGQPAYTYNLFGKTRTTLRGDQPLPAGPTELEFRFDYDEGGVGQGADLELRVNGKRVAQGRIEASVPAFFSIDETFDVGTDTGSAAGEYDPHFAFNGEITRVVLQREDD